MSDRPPDPGPEPPEPQRHIIRISGGPYGDPELKRRADEAFSRRHAHWRDVDHPEWQRKRDALDAHLSQTTIERWITASRGAVKELWSELRPREKRAKAGRKPKDPDRDRVLADVRLLRRYDSDLPITRIRALLGEHHSVDRETIRQRLKGSEFDTEP